MQKHWQEINAAFNNREGDYVTIKKEHQEFEEIVVEMYFQSISKNVEIDQKSHPLCFVRT